MKPRTITDGVRAKPATSTYAWAVAWICGQPAGGNVGQHPVRRGMEALRHDGSVAAGCRPTGERRSAIPAFTARRTPETHGFWNAALALMARSSPTRPLTKGRLRDPPISTYRPAHGALARRKAERTPT